MRQRTRVYAIVLVIVGTVVLASACSGDGETGGSLVSTTASSGSQPGSPSQSPSLAPGGRQQHLPRIRVRASQRDG